MYIGQYVNGLEATAQSSQQKRFFQIRHRRRQWRAQEQGSIRFVRTDPTVTARRAKEADKGVCMGQPAIQTR